MRAKKFKVKRGFDIKGDIQDIGKRLTALERKHKAVEPQIVVDDARDEDSPLHDNFTWDDTEAARKQRITEARYLLQGIEAVYINVGPTKEEVICPVFVNLNKPGSRESMPYQSMSRVLKVSESRNLLLDKALDALEAWKAKYKFLKELASLFEVIEEEKLKLVK